MPRLPGTAEACPCRWLRTQEGQHGKHAPVVLRGVGEPELVEDAADVALDRSLAEEEPLADGRVRAPLGHQPEDLTLAGGEHAERFGEPAAVDQTAHDA